MAAGHSGQSSFGAQFREELTCSICHELFTRPKVLPCQHTFCQDCLQGVAGGKVTLKCPECRRKSRLPPQGVVGLPDNRIAANMCEKFQQQATVSGETTEQPQSGDSCSFHPSEELQLYCKQCQVPLCLGCVDKNHEGHPNMSLKKATEERKSAVQALITEGRNILETYSSFLHGLTKKDKNLDEQKQQRDNSIIQAYNQTKDFLLQNLTERKDKLLSESAQNCRLDKEIIQTERDRVLTDVGELSAACDRAEQEMELGLVEFLRQRIVLTEVVGKHREKAALTPVQTQPADFLPTDTPVPVLGHVAVQSLPSAPIPAAPAASDGAAAGGTGQEVTLGGQGAEAKEFHKPWGVTVSEDGEIFVADSQTIQVFTLQGTFVRQLPTGAVVLGISEYEEMRPYDVAMDGEGNLWTVASTRWSGDFAVQYSKQGRVLRKINMQESGTFRGVAVDTRRNNILVTQTTGHWSNPLSEVQVFRPDGTLVRTVGQKQGMKYPRYIAVDGEGNILVSDLSNHCVYVYNFEGQFLFQFGSKGSGEGQLKSPHGICTDREGNIIVVDCGNERVELFDKTGRFLTHITGTDRREPWAVAVAPQGQLVVTSLLKVSIFIGVQGSTMNY